MRILHTRSIPNVDVERLLDSLNQIHQKYHTIEGLHEFDAPRRTLADMGRKGLLIRDELCRRGERSNIDCRFCSTE